MNEEISNIPWSCGKKLPTAISQLVSGPVGLAQNFRYINLTDKNIFVKLSTGSVHVLVPVAHSMVRGLKPGGLYVVVETSDYYSGRYCPGLGDLSFPATSTYQVRQSIAYSIDIKQADSNGMLYDFRFQTIICTGEVERFSTDPISIDWLSVTNPSFRRLMAAEQEEVARSLDIGIFVIDNTAKNVEYFVNMFGRVYKIISDTTIEGHVNLGDGVYIVSNSNPNTGEVRLHRYDLSDCLVSNTTSRSDLTSPVLLFNSARDAELNGNEREIARREAARAEKEVLSLKEIIAKSEHKRKLQDSMYQAKSAERKDYYEGRSYSRKDRSEGISNTGKVMAGAAAVFTACIGIVKLLC